LERCGYDDAVASQEYAVRADAEFGEEVFVLRKAVVIDQLTAQDTTSEESESLISFSSFS